MDKKTIKRSTHETARDRYVNPLVPGQEWFKLMAQAERNFEGAEPSERKTAARNLEKIAGMAIGPRQMSSQYDIVTINRKSYTDNPQFFGRVLTGVQEFIEEHYKPDDVLSRREFAKELKDVQNKNYTIDAVVDRVSKEIVAVVAHDVVDVPQKITRQELVPGDEQYTSVYYATARGGGKFTTSKQYEPVLQMLIENAMQSGQKYSASRGKTNVGFITIDSRHKRVLHGLAQKYGGGYTPVEVGVPTLRDGVVDKNYPDSNLIAVHNEKPVVIPNGKWTKSMLNRVMGSDLDQSYNKLKPGQTGYVPLTNAKYFKDFAAAVNALPGTHVDFKPIM